MEGLLKVENSRYCLAQFDMDNMFKLYTNSVGTLNDWPKIKINFSFNIGIDFPTMGLPHPKIA